jgi:hypothetical protein
MRCGRLPIRSTVALAIFAVTLLGTNSWAAPREEELYRFKNNGRDGKFPNTLTFEHSISLKASSLSQKAELLFGISSFDLGNTAP